MMAAWRFGFAANASAHIQCFDTGSPGVMIGLHGFCQNSWPRHVFTAPIPSHFFSFPVMIWWIALSAAVKVGFSRRLRHGHRIEMACSLFSCPPSDEDVRETTFAT